MAQILELAGSLQIARLPAPGVDQGPLNRALHDPGRRCAALAADAAALPRPSIPSFTEFTNAGEALPVLSSMMQPRRPGHLAVEWLPASRCALATSSRRRPADPQGAMHGGTATYRLPVIEQRRVNTVSLRDLRALHGAARGRLLRAGRSARQLRSGDALLDTIAQAFITLKRSPPMPATTTPIRALADVRHEITHLIRQRAVNLTPLVRYRVIGPTAANSLAFAWRMYQDSSRDLEVVDRTRARTPAYLPFTGRVLAA